MISNNFSLTISTEEKTSLRLLGSIYAVINLIIIRIIVSDAELDAITICYIGLLLGRFIFFDTSISSIIIEFKNIGRKAILLIVMGAYVSVLLFWYKKNGVDIVGNNMIFQFAIIYCAMIFGLKAAKDINTKIYL
ncbi:hypothetical protein RBU61_05085 [Tissierella sp. MB52-C2]|uniref:hypothetical protein n=1 Tax=Tissierella sp. MB52-C2 TaxID=3070999 RepID=UPI00280B56F3|nr:hypothetical protein [Tissierella sp. MB52-C2]WMM26052.1 hypothetical protein RBU61_05085 [Tissierella sp. MB52-C2]